MSDYNKDEETTFRKDLFNRLDIQDKQLAEIKSDGKETKVQAYKTNGRATALEIRIIDYEKLKEVVNGLSGFKLWLTGAVAVLLLTGSTIGYLFTKNIVYTTHADTLQLIDLHEKNVDSKIQKTVLEFLQDYDKIEIIK